MSGWICGICTFQNTTPCATCQMCTAANPSLPSSTTAAVGGGACPQCTYVNIPDAAMCSVCGLPLKERAEALDDEEAGLLVDPLRCVNCTFLNREGTIECHMCGGPVGVTPKLAVAEDEGDYDEGDESERMEENKHDLTNLKITPELRTQTVIKLKELHKGYPSFLEGAFKPIAPFTKEVKMERITYGQAKSLLASIPQIHDMMDRTKHMHVEDMILLTLSQGLPLFKAMKSAQEEVIHCMQYIFSHLNQLTDKAKRDAWVMKLAKGFQACQTIQHQTIIDLFSSLANVEMDFEKQLLKMLGNYKMGILDQVVTILSPQTSHGEEAPHVRSGYLLAVEGKTGVEFHAHDAAVQDKNRHPLDGAGQDRVANKFLELFAAKDFILEFVADINEKEGFSRSFDRDKFFKWVMSLEESSGFDKHSIFYRVEQKELYSEVQPEKDWGVVPFLCPAVAQNILHLLGITTPVSDNDERMAIHLPTASSATTTTTTASSVVSSTGLFSAVSNRLFKRQK